MTKPLKAKKEPSLIEANRSEYDAWRAMKKACYNKKYPSYKNIGGKGITVIKAWIDSFPTFLADMGKRPSADHVLGRLRQSAGFTRANTRWVKREAVDTSIKTKAVKSTATKVKGNSTVPVPSREALHLRGMPVVGVDDVPDVDRPLKVEEMSRYSKAFRSLLNEIRLTPPGWDNCAERYIHYLHGETTPERMLQLKKALEQRLQSPQMLVEDYQVGLSFLAQGGIRYVFLEDGLAHAADPFDNTPAVPDPVPASIASETPPSVVEPIDAQCPVSAQVFSLKDGRMKIIVRSASGMGIVVFHVFNDGSFSARKK